MNGKNRNYKHGFFKGLGTIIRIVLIVVLFPIVLICLIANARKSWLRKKQTRHLIEIFDESQIDSLSGIEFEGLLKDIFEKQGYESKLTKKSHDYGADLVLKKSGKISLVQAKCYGSNVGIKAVQEIVAAKAHYKASDLFVATNRYFSKDAVVLAIEHGVKLIDRDVLLKLVKKFKPVIEVQGKKYSATLTSSVEEIEKKYKYWI